MHIRIATSLDRDDICEVHLRAFPEGEREIIAKLASNLLSELTRPPTISLVAETKDTIVGHVSFSPVTIVNNENLQGYILAPLGVKPDYQKRHIGSKLIQDGMQRLSEMGVNVLFVYGDPKYYGRFGFTLDTADRYTPPFQLHYPMGWQAIALNKGEIAGTPTKIACVTSLSDPTLW